MRSHGRCAIVICIGIAVFHVGLFAQAPDTLWTRTYGGSDYDFGLIVHQTADSSYIILGTTHTYGAGDADIWLLKTNALGDTQWTKTYGCQYWDEGKSLEQTVDSGYIITGYTELSGMSADLWLIKLDAQGDTLWTRRFGGNSGDDIGYDVKQTADSGFIVTGMTGSHGAGYYDLWLIKTNRYGDTLWTKTYGGGGLDEGYSVVQTNTGGYIIVGYTSSYGAGAEDVWVLETDSLGDTLRSKTLGGGSEDIGFEIIQTNDGGYFILASTLSFGAGMYDTWLLRIDSNIDTIWTKTYGGPNWDIGNSIIQTRDNKYVIAGYKAVSMSADEWIMKIDSIGNPIWDWTFGGNEDDFGGQIRQTYDNGYIFVAYTYSYGMGCSDVWLIKTCPDTLGLAEDQTRLCSRIAFNIYPNPVNKYCTIKYVLPQTSRIVITMYDAAGRFIKGIIDETQGKGAHQLRLTTIDLPAGVYFLQLKTQDFTEMKKILLVR